MDKDKLPISMVHYYSHQNFGDNWNKKKKKTNLPLAPQNE